MTFAICKNFGFQTRVFGETKVRSRAKQGKSKPPLPFFLPQYACQISLKAALAISEADIVIEFRHIYIYIHVMIMIEYLPTILSPLCLISCLSGQTLDFDGFGVPQSSLVNSSCNLLNKPQQAAVINWEAPCQLPPITLLGFEI